MEVNPAETYVNVTWKVSADLLNKHVGHIMSKTNKRLYALRVLRRAGVQKEHMVRVYCSLIRSVLEYAVPVWAALPECLNELLDSVQKKALKIIFPGHNYISALHISGLDSLSVRRDLLVHKFISKARVKEPITYIMPSRSAITHGYSLRSGESKENRVIGTTNRFNNFVTVRFQ